ncbi:MAG: hypothetical protein C0461_07875 [Brevundimonas sp.]|nr:hypothetical protein [Brevundimonas sp.]
MTNLEALIALTPPSRIATLDDLEEGVWDRVAVAQARVRQRTLRVAALCVAAGIGGIAGGVSAPSIEQEPGDLAVFSPRMATTPLDMRSILG